MVLLGENVLKKNADVVAFVLIHIHMACGATPGCGAIAGNTPFLSLFLRLNSR